MKVILNKDEFYKKANEAVELLSGIVKVTLGPDGLPVILERKKMNMPHITKDGVTVAENVEVDDTVTNTIIQAVKGAAQKTGEEGGDGPQPLDSKVLTPSGWVRMGDITVGMKICGTGQSVQEVLGVYPKGEKELVEVEFSNGRVVKCCKDHLWKVVNQNSNKTEVKTTEAIKEDYLMYDRNGEKSVNYYVNSTTSEFLDNSSEFGISPYLLGLLLGSGVVDESGKVMLSIGVKEQDVLDSLSLPKGIIAKVDFVEKENRFKVEFEGKNSDGEDMSTILSKMGIYMGSGTSQFIPKTYLYSSFDSRKKLLEALVATSGYTSSDGQIRLNTVSTRLCDDFLELTRSMGLLTKSRILTRVGHNTNEVLVYRIEQVAGRGHNNYIENIRPTGKYVEMQCIKVSNPDSLYITDNYILTHNTTTSIVLTEAIFKESMKFISSGMITPQKLYTEIANASGDIYEYIDKLSKKVETPEERRNVALISSNNDESIANSIVEAMDKVGQDGYIGLEEGTSRETNLRFIDGIHIEKGYQHWGSIGHGFINIPETQEVIYDNVLVALYNGTISKFTDVEPLMRMVHNIRDQAIKQKKPEPALLIVAHNIIGEAMAVIVQNRIQANFPIFAIKTPISGSPNSASLLLDDLAVLTGGKVLAPEDIPLPRVEYEHLGSVNKIVGKPRLTVLYEPDGNPDEIESRVKALKHELTQIDNEFDRDNMKKRIGQLVNGICLIGVGGNTDLETKEKKDRVDDALCAVRAASESGIVAGAGMTLYNISENIWKNTSQNFGQKVLIESLKYPAKQIMLNGNKNHDRILLNPKIKDYPFGYDARNEEVVNLMESGIIDPAKVVKLSLQSAISIASELFRSGGLVSFKENKNQDSLNNPFIQ